MRLSRVDLETMAGEAVIVRWRKRLGFGKPDKICVSRGLVLGYGGVCVYDRGATVSMRDTDNWIRWEARRMTEEDLKDTARRENGGANETD